MEFFVKVSLAVLICVAFLLFHVENFCCFYFVVVFFSGFGPGCQWHFNGKKYRNDENGERARKKQQNSERKIKFYDANEKKRECEAPSSSTKAIEKFMIRNSRKGSWPMSVAYVERYFFGGRLYRITQFMFPSEFITAHCRGSIQWNRIRVLEISFLLCKVKWPSSIVFFKPSTRWRREEFLTLLWLTVCECASGESRAK